MVASGLRSCQSDVWSFGCLYLELATAELLGARGASSLFPEAAAAIETLGVASFPPAPFLTHVLDAFPERLTRCIDRSSLPGLWKSPVHLFSKFQSVFPEDNLCMYAYIYI